MSCTLCVYVHVYTNVRIQCELYSVCICACIHMGIIIIVIYISDVIIEEKIVPDPASQQLPCPKQTVVYECQVLVGSTALTWILPNMTSLELSGFETTEKSRTSSDGLEIETSLVLMSFRLL